LAARGAEVGAGQIGRVHDGASRSSKYLTLQAPHFNHKNIFPTKLYTSTFYPNCTEEFCIQIAIMQMPDMPVNVPIDDPNADTEW
jgi:hypothetical protein